MHQDLSAPVGTPAPQQEINLLIADVAALTEIPAPQLRSWEQAGLIHPRRSPNAVRLYGVEDVARVRLIKRSLVNPGRRGSLSRLAKQLANGELRPAPEDYAGLVNASAGPVPLPDSLFWQAVVDAMTDLVVVGDTRGRLSYANAALRKLLPSVATTDPSKRPDRSAAGEPLPAAIAALPLRWAASTGTQHRDLSLKLPLQAGGELLTLWSVTPLRGADGQFHGAVGVGRAANDAQGEHQQDGLVGAAHDLRGPLTTILGRLQLARMAMADFQTDRLDNGTRAAAVDLVDRHLGIAELSAHDLTHTLETLLDASAAGAGVLAQHLEAGTARLDFIARETVDRAQRRTTRHQISLECVGAPLSVIGDPVRLRQLLDNLLANSIKYSPDGGPISVQLTALTPSDDATGPLAALRGDPGVSPNWVLVRVSDVGLGIPPDALPYVFDRFWRAEGPTHRLPGSGLGLYTCRAIAAAHGGHIWVERSVPAPDDGVAALEWHGTVMAVAFPVEAAGTNTFGADGFEAATA